jgi:hypothetical protein
MGLALLAVNGRAAWQSWLQEVRRSVRLWRGSLRAFRIRHDARGGCGFPICSAKNSSISLFSGMESRKGICTIFYHRKLSL